MQISNLLPLIMHSAIIIAAIVSVTVLAWHGVVTGNTAVLVIVAAAGINGTGTASFMANGKNTPPAGGP